MHNLLIMNDPQNVDCYKETWMRLGNYLVLADEIDSVAVQAGHIIITFSESYQPHGNFPGQIVLHFGDDGNEKAIDVFDQICALKNAVQIKLPRRYNACPDLSKTYYKETIDREVKRGVSWYKHDFHQRVQKYRERHQRKLEKALSEVKRLRDLYESSDLSKGKS